MCGIAGIFHLDGRSAEKSRVRAMTDSMIHRGPDHQAVMTSGPIGLGHTRLSIIDVSSVAHQPMLSSDGRYGIVFNGEIYNFRELRIELERAGITFRSTSDTEVLLQGFLHWGHACFGKLNGMFGVAIADLQCNELTLARDRFGIKPLYYAIVDGVLLFASEVKAILKALDRAPTLDTLKLLELLLYRELIRGTFFREIRTLEPGCYIQVHCGDAAIREERWFAVEDLLDGTLANELRGMPYRARLDRVEESLRAAVERHLISDVPVGTLCSGGTDSSLLTALCKQINPEVSVYHVDVRGNSERQWANLVAKQLGIVMHHVELEERNFLESYIDCIYFNDFPLTHPNSVAVYHISELARRNGCKVLLTGEGADETFGGYDWRYRYRMRYGALQRTMKWPGKLGSLMTYLITRIWLRRFDPHFNFKSRASVPDVVSFCADFDFRRRHWQRCFERIEDHGRELERTIQASLVSDLRDYISGILHRQDRASMQASIESRVPFLDHTLAHIAVNLPLRDKVTWFDYKPLLKDLAARFLPREVVFREKVGFGTPSDDYARRIDTRVLRSGFLEQTFGMNSDQITNLLDTDFSTFGHQLLGLEFWGRMFVLDQDREGLRERFVVMSENSA